MNERFEGIVLFKRPHREHDGLVKIFTQEFGTKMFFVRGLYRGHHRLTSACLPMTHHTYIGDIQDQGLSFLKESQPIQLFQALQQDILLQAYGIYVLQLVDAALEDNQANPRVYQLLLQVLEALNQGLTAQVIVAYLEIHLLPIFGIHIQWTSCAACQTSDRPLRFSLKRQAVLCDRHASLDIHCLPVSSRAVHVARRLSQVDLKQIQNIDLSDQTLKDLRTLMDAIYQEYVGIRLKSKSYLDQISQLEWPSN
ncbi:DNA repair protein RecO [Abiotrophia defectiva]|uniref:DNA repair protein RecO n=1 Tax=Abiotrophia defectiva TaxID=46125 RepID=UPI0028D14966|nr:DNA repair protein RecO [Abiotrophia defectiva]